MTITYTLGHSLYINVTNKCTNTCDFCVRNNGSGIGSADSLWLDREPTKEEIFEDISKRKLSEFKEIVFCGYGEPLIRLYDVLWVCKKVKEITDIPIRVDTNGQANLIFKENVTEGFKGLIDTISISLNAKNAEDYDKMCHSTFGEDAFYSIIKFAQDCKKYVNEILFTVVSTLPKDDIEQCRKIAEEIGVKFRIREYIK